MCALSINFMYLYHHILSSHLNRYTYKYNNISLFFFGDFFVAELMIQFTADSHRLVFFIF